MSEIKKVLKYLVGITILLVVGVFLFNMIIDEAFKQYANCYYLVDQLPFKPRVICDGVNLLVFKLDGVNSTLNPLMEQARITLIWSVIAFFTITSLLLTILVNNFEFIIGILTFRKYEWMQLIAGTRIWLVFMVILGLVFYYFVIFSHSGKIDFNAIIHGGF